MSQTRDQQRFTISEVAVDWHEPMVPQRLSGRQTDITRPIRTNAIILLWIAADY